MLLSHGSIAERLNTDILHFAKTADKKEKI